MSFSFTGGNGFFRLISMWKYTRIGIFNTAIFTSNVTLRSVVVQRDQFGSFPTLSVMIACLSDQRSYSADFIDYVPRWWCVCVCACVQIVQNSYHVSLAYRFGVWMYLNDYNMFSTEGSLHTIAATQYNACKKCIPPLSLYFSLSSSKFKCICYI